MAVQLQRWDFGDMDNQQSPQPPEGALSPKRVKWYLKHFPYRDALPRPGRLIQPEHQKKRSGNPDELTWATYGMLFDCIQQLSPRRRDIVIRATVYGDPFERVGQRWRIHASTAWREERRAIDQIAAMTGFYDQECEE